MTFFVNNITFKPTWMAKVSLCKQRPELHADLSSDDLDSHRSELGRERDGFGMVLG